MNEPRRARSRSTSVWPYRSLSAPSSSTSKSTSEIRSCAERFGSEAKRRTLGGPPARSDYPCLNGRGGPEETLSPGAAQGRHSRLGERPLARAPGVSELLHIRSRLERDSSDRVRSFQS